VLAAELNIPVFVLVIKLKEGAEADPEAVLTKPPYIPVVEFKLVALTQAAFIMLLLFMFKFWLTKFIPTKFLEESITLVPAICKAPDKIFKFPEVIHMLPAVWFITELPKVSLAVQIGM
jgi:hypothetical protein